MHPTLFLAVKESVRPQIAKDRFSHVMTFPWSSNCRWQSTGIWFYIDCHYDNLRMLKRHIGSKLTRKGVCEQAEHVMWPQEYMRVEYNITMKTGTNQLMQKYRCSYKAIKWSKHLQKRKLRVFLQYGGREMYCSDSWEFCVLIFRSRHFHSKSKSACVRLTCRPECTYCLIYFYMLHFWGF